MTSGDTGRRHEEQPERSQHASDASQKKAVPKDFVSTRRNVLKGLFFTPLVPPDAKIKEKEYEHLGVPPKPRLFDPARNRALRDAAAEARKEGLGNSLYQPPEITQKYIEKEQLRQYEEISESLIKRIKNRSEDERRIARARIRELTLQISRRGKGNVTHLLLEIREKGSSIWRVGLERRMGAEEKRINSELDKLARIEETIHASLPLEDGPLKSEMMERFPNRDRGYGSERFNIPKISDLTLNDFSLSTSPANVRAELKEFRDHYVRLSKLEGTKQGLRALEARRLAEAHRLRFDVQELNKQLKKYKIEKLSTVHSINEMKKRYYNNRIDEINGDIESKLNGIAEIEGRHLVDIQGELQEVQNEYATLEKQKYAALLVMRGESASASGDPGEIKLVWGAAIARKYRSASTRHLRNNPLEAYERRKAENKYIKAQRRLGEIVKDGIAYDHKTRNYVKIEQQDDNSGDHSGNGEIELQPNGKQNAQKGEYSVYKKEKILSSDGTDRAIAAKIDMIQTCYDDLWRKMEWSDTGSFKAYHGIIKAIVDESYDLEYKDRHKFLLSLRAINNELRQEAKSSIDANDRNLKAFQSAFSDAIQKTREAAEWARDRGGFDFDDHWIDWVGIEQRGIKKKHIGKICGEYLQNEHVCKIIGDERDAEQLACSHSSDKAIETYYQLIQAKASMNLFSGLLEDGIPGKFKPENFFSNREVLTNPVGGLRGQIRALMQACDPQRSLRDSRAAILAMEKHLLDKGLVGQEDLLHLKDQAGKELINQLIDQKQLMPERGLIIYEWDAKNMTMQCTEILSRTETDPNKPLYALYLKDNGLSFYAMSEPKKGSSGHLGTAGPHHRDRPLVVNNSGEFVEVINKPQVPTPSRPRSEDSKLARSIQELKDSKLARSIQEFEDSESARSIQEFEDPESIAGSPSSRGTLAAFGSVRLEVKRSDKKSVDRQNAGVLPQRRSSGHSETGGIKSQPDKKQKAREGEYSVKKDGIPRNRRVLENDFLGVKGQLHALTQVGDPQLLPNKRNSLIRSIEEQLRIVKVTDLLDPNNQKTLQFFELQVAHILSIDPKRGLYIYEWDAQNMTWQSTTIFSRTESDAEKPPYELLQDGGFFHAMLKPSDEEQTGQKGRNSRRDPFSQVNDKQAQKPLQGQRPFDTPISRPHSPERGSGHSERRLDPEREIADERLIAQTYYDLWNTMNQPNTETFRKSYGMAQSVVEQTIDVEPEHHQEFLDHLREANEVLKTEAETLIKGSKVERGAFKTVLNKTIEGTKIAAKRAREIEAFNLEDHWVTWKIMRERGISKKNIEKGCREYLLNEHVYNAIYGNLNVNELVRKSPSEAIEIHGQLTRAKVFIDLISDQLKDGIPCKSLPKSISGRKVPVLENTASGPEDQLQALIQACNPQLLPQTRDINAQVIAGTLVTGEWAKEGQLLDLNDPALFQEIKDHLTALDLLVPNRGLYIYEHTQQGTIQCTEMFPRTETDANKPPYALLRDDGLLYAMSEPSDEKQTGQKGRKLRRGQDSLFSKRLSEEGRQADRGKEKKT